MRVKFAIAIAYLFIAVVTLFQPVQARAQELVLYFPFEGRDNTKIVEDKSGKNNHGKFDNGKAKRVASKDKPFGKAMEFDMSRIIVEGSKSLDVPKISIAMWANKFTETGGNGLLPRIISRGPNDQLELAMDSGHKQKGSFAVYARGITGWNQGMPVKEKSGIILPSLTMAKFSTCISMGNDKMITRSRLQASCLCKVLFMLGLVIRDLEKIIWGSWMNWRFTQEF